MCPSRESPDFQVIMHDDGTCIEIGYDIKKIFPSEAKVSHLKNIYGFIDNYKIKCVEKLIYSHENVIYLEPRGEEKKPQNPNELLKALICVLTCLEGLHNIKPSPVMHRNIQWPNIIQYGNQYILIDFDFASFSPSNENLQDLNPDNHAPEIGINNELPDELLSLSQSMCQKDINARPNASDTLRIFKGFFVKWFPNDDWLNHFDN
ncbi:8471_t:CDS:2 [Entrophospora sp. SA101]|nr:8471_t:CDS:2 [Entrophospora sp. SA101]